MANFKARFDFKVQKHQKRTTSKVGIFRSLSVLLSDFWPIY